MKNDFFLKFNAYFLLTIIPASFMGYYFAVHKESLFFLYEWMLSGIVIISILFAIKNMVSIKNERKWVAISIFSFLIQFSLLGLFLGPFTYYFMFYLYFAAAILSFLVFIITIRTNNSLRIIPVIFIILTGIFTLYMILLMALWGNDLS